MSVEVGYYRRWWNHFTPLTDNILTKPSDYDQFNLTAPLDARLPGGGGYTVGPLYDIRPATGLVGQFNNVIHNVEDYGDYSRHADYIDIGITARLRNGLTLQGGTSTGRVAENTCATVAGAPEFVGSLTTGATRPLAAAGATLVPYCDYKEPFSRTGVKGTGSYIIPKVDVQIRRDVLQPAWRPVGGERHRADGRSLVRVSVARFFKPAEHNRQHAADGDGLRRQGKRSRPATREALQVFQEPRERGVRRGERVQCRRVPGL